MKTQIPLGRAEDQHLEFKSAESLEKPEAIGREVAAMLNSEGGEVWIGLGEQDGVAVELQPIPDSEKAASSLLDSLVDRLEPSPLPEEVRIAPVSTSEGLAILRVQVHEGMRKPYALLRNGARSYQLRIGSRLRSLSREELFARSADRQLDEDRFASARQRILEARDAAQEAVQGSMWLRIEPAELLSIDIQSAVFEEVLFDPARTGNRRIGWHFVEASAGPELHKERIAWCRGDSIHVEVSARGSMTFQAKLKSLFWKGEELVFWPLALLEYPISAFRLARVIVGSSGPTTEPVFLADLALFGMRGWKLRPGSIDGDSSGFGWQRNRPIAYPESEEDLTSSRPLEFSFDELMTEPDRCGFRLVRRVYEAFGCPEDRMPHEFDRESGRLILPE